MGKDYVKRSKPTAKGKGKSSATPSSNGSKLPPFVVIIALLAVIGFVYFLYSIKDNVPDSANSKPVNIEQPKPQLVKNKDKISKQKELPPKPQIRSYIEELENKEVQIDLPDKDKKPKRPYLMQCGSFRNRNDAESLKAKIAFQGLVAEVKSSDNKSGRWYRVVQGPFATKRKAESAKHQLARAKITGCAIWFWPQE